MTKAYHSMRKLLSIREAHKMFCSGYLSGLAQMCVRTSSSRNPYYNIIVKYRSDKHKTAGLTCLNTVKLFDHLLSFK